MNCSSLPFTSRIVSTELPKVATEATTSEKLAEAVCPAEFTVTVGIYVPGGVAVLAVKVIWPEGLVSLAAYVHCIPVGRLPTFTSAVSLVELMRICTTTGIPSCDTVIFDMGNETEIGGA